MKRPDYLRRSHSSYHFPVVVELHLGRTKIERAVNIRSVDITIAILLFTNLLEFLPRYIVTGTAVLYNGKRIKYSWRSHRNRATGRSCKTSLHEKNTRLAE